MFYEITHAINKRSTADELIEVCQALLKDGVTLLDLISALRESMDTYINDVNSIELIKSYYFTLMI
ncbi:hypothetical protein [Tolumonas lignilytica]|uniref:hypothetical protein n=1 Tax=Tolumonas lignilytica TaxID=1283284 RepID=UPI000467B34E|nr:hypothetical protein [Tolumonas lignilytica]